ncbi:MAG: hypothetical protein NUV34_03525 [Sulfuricaulis sp.]|nr:hypothetical protein [Sulfuricaulis sp.]
MSGTLVIWSLVAHNAPVLALVPITRIKEGDLPINTVMPAIAITRVDAIPRLTVAMTESNRMHSERVQVTPVLKTTDGSPAGLGKKGVDALIALIRTACPNQHGTVAGINVVSILPDTVGPDLSDAATFICSGSIDFIVKWKS